MQLLSSSRGSLSLLVLLALSLASACGSSSATGESADPGSASAPPVAAPEIVRPPFAVRGELEGLLLVWFDADGPHSAQSRSDIPEAHRAQVRVDSLQLAPDARLDPAFVYLADVRAPGQGGNYVVYKVARESFEGTLSAARAAALAAAQPVPGAAGGSSSDVIVYGASWCGACRQAEAYLRSRGVPFLIKDIEREPGAQQEMTRKAQAQGLNPTGIPVIDFRGQLLLGFDQESIDRLIASAPPTVGPSASPNGLPSVAPPLAPPSGSGGARPI